MIKDENITCPACNMGLYQDEGVFRCENIACKYQRAMPDSQTKSTSGKKSLWDTIKNIWVACGVIKWIVLGVIALTGTISFPAFSSNPPAVEESYEHPEHYQTPNPTIPESTATSTTPSDTVEPSVSPENNSDTYTVLNGEDNGIEWEYRGHVHNNKPHGNGRQELSNGNFFDGEWSHGRFLNGNGMEISEAGHFVGTFVNGFWSEGILQMSPSGAKYEGTFTNRNGRHYRHGQGRIEFPNGDWYEGGWSFDQRHGQGVTFHAESGSRQSGVWINNVLQ